MTGKRQRFLNSQYLPSFLQIDSALDTHKVVRVAALLADRASTGNEQCVIISHRPEMHERGR